MEALDKSLLVHFLRDKGRISDEEFEGLAWETLIRQGRFANLLSRVAVMLSDNGDLNRVPEPARTHLLNAIKISVANARSARWEISDTYKILSNAGIEFIVLKGCAYIWVENEASKGRLFGDSDILVRESQIGDAETVLVHNGWVGTKFDRYDQLYYRKWMHEIPPLHHVTRHTSLDVHHHILPLLDKTKFDIDEFWNLAIEDRERSGLYTLPLADMILHSAVHLFHEGEFDNGLRDVSDLHLLLSEYMAKGLPWEQLLDRAKSLVLSGSLYYALKYSKVIFRAQIPQEVIQQAARDSGFGWLHNTVMDFLFLRALLPNHRTCPVPGSGFSRWALFMRAHFIKMPLWLLLPHLVRKTLGPASE